MSGGSRSPACEAVIFDLDGTLLDTLADLAESANAALQAVGAPPHPLASYRQLVGGGVRRLMERALPEHRRDDATVAAAVEAMRAQYALRWAATSRPYPGIPALLDALAAQGVPVGVLSNKPHDFTVKMVAALLAPWAFRAVAGAQPGVPLKPDPASALALADALGVPPARCALVGDSDVDMLTARAAGMRAVGAAWGFRGPEELVAAGADLLLHRPSALLALFPPATDGRTEGESPR